MYARSNSINLALRFLFLFNIYTFPTLIEDNLLARSSLTAFIDYGNGLESDKVQILCNQDCLNGVFIGNMDVRHANQVSGRFKLVIVIHGYMNDKFRVDLVSFGDLVLASEINEESRGMN